MTTGRTTNWLGKALLCVAFGWRPGLAQEPGTAWAPSFAPAADGFQIPSGDPASLTSSGHAAGFSFDFGMNAGFSLTTTGHAAPIRGDLGALPGDPELELDTSHLLAQRGGGGNGGGGRGGGMGGGGGGGGGGGLSLIQISE
ncbi:MAG: hypothetical protein ACK5WR_18700, partial [Planctomycetaceae bacterium]